MGSWGMIVKEHLFHKFGLSILVKILFLRGFDVGLRMRFCLIKGSVMGGVSISLELLGMNLSRLSIHGCLVNYPSLYLHIKNYCKSVVEIILLFLISPISSIALETTELVNLDSFSRNQVSNLKKYK